MQTTRQLNNNAPQQLLAWRSITTTNSQNDYALVCTKFIKAVIEFSTDNTLASYLRLTPLQRELAGELASLLRGHVPGVNSESESEPELGSEPEELASASASQSDPGLVVMSESEPGSASESGSEPELDVEVVIEVDSASNCEAMLGLEPDAFDLDEPGSASDADSELESEPEPEPEIEPELEPEVDSEPEHEPEPGVDSDFEPASTSTSTTPISSLSPAPAINMSAAGRHMAEDTAIVLIFRLLRTLWIVGDSLEGPLITDFTIYRLLFLLCLSNGQLLPHHRVRPFVARFVYWARITLDIHIQLLLSARRLMLGEDQHSEAASFWWDLFNSTPAGQHVCAEYMQILTHDHTNGLLPPPIEIVSDAHLYLEHGNETPFSAMKTATAILLEEVKHAGMATKFIWVNNGRYDTLDYGSRTIRLSDISHAYHHCLADLEHLLDSRIL
ncbi:hypothetical protein GQ54DRAFT_314968, partial [Martensiomyces pterosporus]